MPSHRADQRRNGSRDERRLADADESDREDARRRVNSTAAAVGDDVRVTTSVREGEDVAAAIVAATEEFDLTVIGATREGLLQQLVFGAVPETVGRDAASTVIMAKRDLGVISWATRWFKRRRDDYHVRNGDGE
ncbi:universal stress protein [Haloferax sp. AB510]|nr:universal stress protein [Haloferax sp. AB510]